MSDAEIILAERERASTRVEKLQRDHAKERLELITSMMESVYQRDERVADLLIKLEEKDRLRHSEVSGARAELDQARRRIAQLEREAEVQVLDNARKRKLETETHEVQVRGLEQSQQSLQARLVEQESAMRAQVQGLEESKRLLEERLSDRTAALEEQSKLATDRQQLQEKHDALRLQNIALEEQIVELQNAEQERVSALDSLTLECETLIQKFTTLENNSVEMLKQQRQEKQKALASAAVAEKSIQSYRRSFEPTLEAFDELRAVSLIRRPFKKIGLYKNLLQALLKTSDAMRA